MKTKKLDDDSHALVHLSLPLAASILARFQWFAANDVNKLAKKSCSINVPSIFDRHVIINILNVGES